MRYKLVVFAVAILYSLYTIASANSIVGTAQSTTSNSNAACIELNYEEDFSYGFLYAWSYFQTSSGTTHSEIIAHAEAYIERLKEHKNVFEVCVLYYDTINSWRFRDRPMASVWWGPTVATPDEEQLLIENNDYSTHTFSAHWYQYNPECELTEEENDIYADLQEYAINKIGRPLYSAETFEDIDNTTISEYSQVSGISHTDLIEIRQKASCRWSDEVFTGATINDTQSFRTNVLRIFIAIGLVILGIVICWICSRRSQRHL